MAFISETSHEKNVDNIAALLTRVEALGGSYCALTESLKLSVLQEQLDTARKNLDRVKKAENNFWKVVETRKLLFNQLVEHCNSIQQCFRVSVPHTRPDELAAPTADKIKEAEHNLKEERRSQKMYSMAEQYFEQIIQLLESYESYRPKTSDLDVENFKNTLMQYRSANKEVVLANVALNTARKMRDDFLYSNHGLITIARDLKCYVEKAVDLNSPEYTQIASLTFKA